MTSTERASLQGDLEDFALIDIVRLLARSAKTGHLVVDTVAGAGGLWLRDGGLLAAAPPALPAVEPLPPNDEVVFELARRSGGRFTFTRDGASPLDAEPAAVEPILVGAEELLVGWRDTLAVVPSLGCGLALCAELAGDEAVIEASQWRLVVAIGSGTTVGDLGAAAGLGEVEVSRAVAALVRAGFAEIVDPSTVTRPALAGGRRAWEGEHGGVAAAEPAVDLGEEATDHHDVVDGGGRGADDRADRIPAAGPGTAPLSVGPDRVDGGDGGGRGADDRADRVPAAGPDAAPLAVGPDRVAGGDGDHGAGDRADRIPAAGPGTTPLDAGSRRAGGVGPEADDSTGHVLATESGLAPVAVWGPGPAHGGDDDHRQQAGEEGHRSADVCGEHLDRGPLRRDEGAGAAHDRAHDPAERDGDGTFVASMPGVVSALGEVASLVADTQLGAGDGGDGFGQFEELTAEGHAERAERSTGADGDDLGRRDDGSRVDGLADGAGRGSDADREQPDQRAVAAPDGPAEQHVSDLATTRVDRSSLLKMLSSVRG